METIRLYDRDAYATSFSARVISCEEVKKKKTVSYQVLLDQTLFFPEEGGQSADRGTIEGIEVLDVQIRKGVITHTLAAPLTAGQEVTGRIDWKHRFYNMQQHSGEHIFSGIVHGRFGYDNVGFHLSDQVVTMDFNGPMSAEEVEAVEERANEVITSNLEVLVSYPSREELAGLSYRSKIEIEGQVRIVTIPGVDVCACCAPHVHRTGEIGMLKVMNVSIYKGGVRISILCGFRALEAFREKNRIISELMNLLTTGQDRLVDSVTKLKNNNSLISGQLAQAKQTLLNQKLEKIPAEQKDVILFENGIETNIARNAVNLLTEQHPGVCAVFIGEEESGYNFIIGSTSQDCRTLAAVLRNKLGARGGGSDRMIQGSVKASPGQILETLGIEAI